MTAHFSASYLSQFCTCLSSYIVLGFFLFFKDDSVTLFSYSQLFLLLLPTGKPAEDEVKLGSLKLKPNTKIMMMGTREESLVSYWLIQQCLGLNKYMLDMAKVLFAMYLCDWLICSC